MDPTIAKKILALQAIQRLKKANALNPRTARMVLSDDPEALAARLQTLEAVSGMFHGPFGRPDSSVAGPVALALAENRQVIGMLPHECHVLVAGMTGMGKTTLLRLIFAQALRLGLKVWLFARAGDLRCLVDTQPDILTIPFDGKVKINPLNPSGLAEDDYCNVFGDIFIQSQRLYDGTKSFLLEHLNKLYVQYREHGRYPSLHDLYEHIRAQRYPGYSRTAAYRESALNRLGGILFGTLGKVFDCAQGHEDSLLENNCLFEIDRLTMEQQGFLSNLLLTKLFLHRLDSENPDWIFVGIDDGNLLFDASLEKRPDLGLPIIHQLLSTVRKSRINVFCCTQAPHQIGSSIHSNSSVKILFNLVNGQDVDFMHRSLGNLTPEQKEFCFSLGPGQVIVKNSFRFPAPVFGVVPEIISARMVSDEEIQNHNEALLSSWPPVVPRYAPQEAVSPYLEKETESQAKSESAIHDNLKQYLMAVNLHQYQKTATEISALAGFSAGTGSRVANKCEKDGLLKMITVPFGRGKPKYPVLTPEAYEVLGVKEKKFFGKGAGQEHILYQHLIANRFADYQPVIELNRKGKFIDVAVELDGKLIAIEVAMTAANEKANIEKDLSMANADHVVVACKDDKVLRQVKEIVAGLPETLREKTRTVLISEVLSPKHQLDDFVTDQPGQDNIPASEVAS